MRARCERRGDRLNYPDRITKSRNDRPRAAGSRVQKQEEGLARAEFNSALITFEIQTSEKPPLPPSFHRNEIRNVMGAGGARRISGRLNYTNNAAALLHYINHTSHGRTRAYHRSSNAFEALSFPSSSYMYPHFATRP